MPRHYFQDGRAHTHRYGPNETITSEDPPTVVLADWNAFLRCRDYHDHHISIYDSSAVFAVDIPLYASLTIAKASIRYLLHGQWRERRVMGFGSTPIGACCDCLVAIMRYFAYDRVGNRATTFWQQFVASSEPVGRSMFARWSLQPPILVRGNLYGVAALGHELLDLFDPQRPEAITQTADALEQRAREVQRGQRHSTVHPRFLQPPEPLDVPVYNRADRAPLTGEEVRQSRDEALESAAQAELED